MEECSTILIGNDVNDNCNLKKNVTCSQIAWYQEKLQLQRFSALAEHADILIAWEKRFILIIIKLCINNNVVLIFIFLPAVKHRYETFQN